MVDACTIDRPLGESTYDPVSDGYVQAVTELYAGRCRVKPRDNTDRQVEAAGESVMLWPYIVSVPMSVTSVTDDDVVTVTASALDPALVGVRLRVRQVAQGSLLTARRLGAEVQT